VLRTLTPKTEGRRGSQRRLDGRGCYLGIPQNAVPQSFRRVPRNHSSAQIFLSTVRRAPAPVPVETAAALQLIGSQNVRECARAVADLRGGSTARFQSPTVTPADCWRDCWRTGLLDRRPRWDLCGGRRATGVPTATVQSVDAMGIQQTFARPDKRNPSSKLESSCSTAASSRGVNGEQRAAPTWPSRYGSLGCQRRSQRTRMERARAVRQWRSDRIVADLG